MPLGLPNHLAPRIISAAFSNASHAIALFCVVAALIDIVALQSGLRQVIIWPALFALLPFFVTIYLLHRRRTAFYAAAYLIVGTASIYWFAVAGIIVLFTGDSSNSYVLTLVKLAMIFVGAGRSPARTIAWSFGGYVASELAVLSAVATVGATWTFDWWSFGAFASVTAFLVGIAANAARSERVQPTLARAARDDRVAAVRYRIEAKAAAMMHDTVLNHLAAIASSTEDRLPPAMRTAMSRDLEVLIGEEWLLDAELPDAGSAGGWRDSPLSAVIEETRGLGLRVEVSGDLGAIGRLAAPHATAVALAAKQCLVNVIRHSGVMAAEVVVYGSESEVSVMVVDAGRGFSEAETGADRLGLRQSVRNRIEAVDGAVQLWSTPGRGTSVMIRVPATVAGDTKDAVLE